MDILSKDELRALINVQTVGCICISIYMPTYRSGRADTQQNPARLKNLLRTAHDRLVEIGLRRPEADEYLGPAERLVGDDYFWRTQADGLAVFLSKDYFRYYRLPVPFLEMVVASDRFSVKPLLPMLSADGLFYVMGLSQKVVRLLQCTRFSFSEVNISGRIPRSMGEALAAEDADREAQYHHHYGRGLESLGGVPIVAHGQEVEETKENLLRYFHLVDHGLHREILRNETAPLAIISVDYLFPIYKEANTYDHLLDSAAHESPDRLSPRELHQAAWGVVEPYFTREQEKALKQYRKFAGAGRTTNDLTRIVPESYFGRIYILFVDATKRLWGNFDPYENRLETHVGEESCDVDLLDFAAAHTLAHRGTVYAVEPDRVPGGGPVAAVLKYSPPQAA